MEIALEPGDPWMDAEEYAEFVNHIKTEKMIQDANDYLNELDAMDKEQFE